METLERPAGIPETEPLSPRPIQVQNVALSILATLALFVLLRYGSELFVPLVLSILFAFALNPFVTLLERFHIHRSIASAVIVAGLILSAASSLYALRFQAMVVLENLPSAVGRLRSQVLKYRRSASQSSNPIGKIQETAKEIEKAAAAATDTASAQGVTKIQVEQPPFRVSEYIWSSSVGLIALINNSMLVSFLVFFLLASGDLFKRKFVRIIGTSLSEKRMTVEVLNEIRGQIEHFLLIQVLTCIAVGVCTGVALWSFGVNQPALWGAVAGLLSSIPYLGPVFVTVAVALVAFLQFDSILIASKVSLITVAIFSLEGLLVKPAVMGKAARINGAAMFIGLLFWTWVWGLIGLIVAVPVMMIIKSVCDRVDRLHFVGELLDDH